MQNVQYIGSCSCHWEEQKISRHLEATKFHVLLTPDNNNNFDANNQRYTQAMREGDLSRSVPQQLLSVFKPENRQAYIMSNRGERMYNQIGQQDKCEDQDTDVSNAAVAGDMLKSGDEDAESSILKRRRRKARSLIYFAGRGICYFGDHEAVQQLLEEGVCANAQNDDGTTALHHCWLNSIAKLLIENGADVNVRNKDRLTPLQFACLRAKRRNANIAMLLIENGAAVNVKDKNGLTPLHHFMIKPWCLEYVKMLIKNGADINAKDNYNERTPLHHACNYRNLEAAKFLIQNDAKVNDKDRYGTTPLHLACFNDHFEMIKLLCENGADPNAKHKSGKTPLDFAMEGNHTDIVWLLVRQNPSLV